MTHPQYTPEQIARFWSKVDTSAGPDGCWLWTAGLDISGYGDFRLTYTPKIRKVKAHRFSYLLAHGAIPDDVLVLHKCPEGGTRRCVNPRHLALGDHLENAQDRERDGRTARGDRNGSRLYPERLTRGDASPARQHPERMPRGERHGSHTKPERVPRGERHGNTKLTDADVIAMRQMFDAGGYSQTAIAARFGISLTSANKIIRRKAWTHI